MLTEYAFCHRLPAVFRRRLLASPSNICVSTVCTVVLVARPWLPLLANETQPKTWIVGVTPIVGYPAVKRESSVATKTRSASAAPTDRYSQQPVDKDVRRFSPSKTDKDEQY